MILLLLVGFGIGIAASRGGVRIQGLRHFTGLSHTHTAVPVTYPQIPPVGGSHNPIWLNCGVYSAAVPNGNAVHSLEHGAVWITYRPSLAARQRKLLTQLARGKSYVLVSPYPGLPAPVVASAWGVQLRLSQASDPRLLRFLNRYRGGPQGGEQGAPCTGGVGTPAP